MTIRQTWGGHIPREIGSASLWGLESDCGAAYLADTARALVEEAEADANALRTILDS